MFRRWSATRVVVLAVLVGLIAVLTLAVRVPIAPTRGYIHLGDVGVYFAALAFGPLFGFVAGGLGTGMADLLGGYGQWAFFSLLIHGTQGLVAGVIGHRASVIRQVIGWLIGAVIMVLGYFLVELAVFKYGVGVAALEVPLNAIQATVGGLVAIPLTAALRRAWPPIDTLGTPKTWEER